MSGSASFPLAVHEQRAPDLIEPIAAFRSWLAVDGRLRSLNVPHFWDERRVYAQCVPAARDAFDLGPHAHAAPQPDCACGIYASFEPDRRLPSVDHRAVTGVVTLWGNVELHAEGMRAQHAQIEALALYTRWTSRQKELVWTIAEELGVDLVDLDEIEEAALRYGRPFDPRVLDSDLR